jgi:hypothetical protein
MQMKGLGLNLLKVVAVIAIVVAFNVLATSLADSIGFGAAAPVALATMVLLKPGALDAPATGGAQRINNFPTGRTYRAILSISGSHDQAAGGGNNGTLREDSPYTLITDLEVKSRKGTFVKSNGQMLFHLARYEDKIAPTFSAPAVAGVSNNAFSMILPVPFSPSKNNLLVPQALLADHRDGDEPKISVTYAPSSGTSSPFVDGGDRVMTLSGIATDLAIFAEDEGVSPDLIRTLERTTKPIAAAQTDFQIDLTARKGRRTRKIQILARRAGVRSNAQVTGRVKLLKASGQSFFESTWAELAELNQEHLGAAPPTGVRWIDFDQLKALAGLPETERFSAYKLQLDVAAPSGTTEIDVLVDSVIDRQVGLG